MSGDLLNNDISNESVNNSNPINLLQKLNQFLSMDYDDTSGNELLEISSNSSLYYHFHNEDIMKLMLKVVVPPSSDITPTFQSNFVAVFLAIYSNLMKFEPIRSMIVNKNFVVCLIYHCYVSTDTFILKECFRGLSLIVFYDSSDLILDYCDSLSGIILYVLKNCLDSEVLGYTMEFLKYTITKPSSRTFYSYLNISYNVNNESILHICIEALSDHTTILQLQKFTINQREIGMTSLLYIIQCIVTENIAILEQNQSVESDTSDAIKRSKISEEFILNENHILNIITSCCKLFLSSTQESSEDISLNYENTLVLLNTLTIAVDWIKISEKSEVMNKLIYFLISGDSNQSMKSNVDSSMNKLIEFVKALHYVTEETILCRDHYHANIIADILMVLFKEISKFSESTFSKEVEVTNETMFDDVSMPSQSMNCNSKSEEKVSSQDTGKSIIYEWIMNSKLQIICDLLLDDSTMNWANDLARADALTDNLVLFLQYINLLKDKSSQYLQLNNENSSPEEKSEEESLLKKFDDISNKIRLTFE